MTEQQIIELESERLLERARKAVLSECTNLGMSDLIIAVWINEDGLSQLAHTFYRDRAFYNDNDLILEEDNEFALGGAMGYIQMAEEENEDYGDYVERMEELFQALPDHERLDSGGWEAGLWCDRITEYLTDNVDRLDFSAMRERLGLSKEKTEEELEM